METENKDVFHDWKRRQVRLLERLKEHPSLSLRNKELILAFHKYNVAKGDSLPTVNKLLENLLLLTPLWENKDFDQTDFQKENNPDFENLKYLIQEKHWAPRSKFDKVGYLRQFFQFLNYHIYGKNEYPPCLKNFKRILGTRHKKIPEQMWTEDEVFQVVENGCRTVRDRAMLALAFDCGGRASEVFGNTKIKHVEFGVRSGSIVLEGKTGMRKTPIYPSIPYLMAWLDIHPLRNDPEAPLFVMESKRDEGKPLTYASVRAVIRKSVRKVGVSKPTNLHIFRKSRATALAPYMTESQLCEFFGWRIGSKEPAKYIHLSGKQVTSTFERIYGIRVEENESEDQKQTIIRCGICTFSNKGNSLLCANCLNPLSSDEAIRVLVRTQDLNQIKEEIQVLKQKMR